MNSVGGSAGLGNVEEGTQLYAIAAISQIAYANIAANRDAAGFGAADRVVFNYTWEPTLGHEPPGFGVSYGYASKIQFYR